jgi:hypothetical protein
MLTKFKYFFRFLQNTEHDAGNSDYDDDDYDDDDDDDDGDDDVTDGAVGGGYPNRVSSVPGFRCDTVHLPLDSRPDYVTRAGRDDESGSSGLPRPNVTDRDQEKDEGATAMHTSCARYGADSPSCSTLDHHTYTSFPATPYTSSDSTPVQSRKVGERILCCNSFSYIKLKFTMIQANTTTNSWNIKSIYISV